MKQSALHFNNLEFVEVPSVEWGILSPLQALYSAYPNPFPYPPIVALCNNKFYLIDGAKRSSAQKNCLALLDSSIKISNNNEQLEAWLNINRKYREINLLEKSVLLTSSYKNILKLPLKVQHFIAANGPSHTIMNMLDCAPPNLLNIVERILSICVPNNPTFKLLLDNLFDLASRDQLDQAGNSEFFKLVEQSGIKDGCNRLAKIRRPNLSKKELAIKAEINSNDAKSIKINYDENFEADHLIIKAELKDQNDLDTIIKDLEKLRDQNKIKKILDIYES